MCIGTCRLLYVLVPIDIDHAVNYLEEQFQSVNSISRAKDQ